MIIDLCCGLGRFKSPNEEIISIDIQRKVKPTIIADIKHLPLKPDLKPRLCHASPPCKYISKARLWRWGWNPKGIAETFKLIAVCYEAFDYLGAKNCSFEHPKGLEDFLGKKITFKYNKYDIKNATTNFYLNTKSLKRSIIPQDVRQKILELC